MCYINGKNQRDQEVNPLVAFLMRDDFITVKRCLRPNGKQSDRTGEGGQRRAHDTIEMLRSAPRSGQWR
jgi:hypothetical protein